MSPRPSRPDNILPGDHDEMSPAQLRSHYSKGCTHTACRAAINEYQKAKQASRRAAAKATTEPEEQTGDEEPAAPDAEPAPEPEPEPEPDPTPATADRVPALGVSRRLQGLVFAGHAPVDIARVTQISVDAIWWLLLEQATTVTETTFRIISREFLRMRTQVPEPSAKTQQEKEAATARSKSLARAQAWSGPFAWTNIDLDEKPTHQGEPGAGTKNRVEPVDVGHMPEPQPVAAEPAPATPEPAEPLSAPWADDFRAAVEHLENAARAISEGLKAIDA